MKCVKSTVENFLDSVNSGLGVFVWTALLIAVLSLTATAAPIKPGDERVAVRGWLHRENQPLGCVLGTEIGNVETFSGDNGTPEYYVVYLKPTGFVIVAADDEIEPIIAFSSGDKFDASAANPLGALVGQDLPKRLAQVRKQEASAGGAVPAGQALADSAVQAQKKWAALIEAGDTNGPSVEMALQSISDVRCAPLLQTKWSQSTVGGLACYNYYTPTKTAGSAANYVCGCVATAMAQLMRYHQYPTVGIGVNSFSIKVDGVSRNASTRGGNGSGGAYSWSSMVYVPTSSSTLAQRQAIGALTYDAGVSVNMSYAADGSGTDTLLARDALTSVFRYSQAKGAYNSGSDLGSALTRIVNPNLDAKYPVLFGIQGSGGGHAIVCDGYGYNGSTVYHHLNMGWSGSDDAWYALPAINTTDYSFSSVYKCVYNVFVNGTGEIISGRVVNASGSALSGVVVTATRAGGGTYSATTDTKGIFALTNVPSSSSYTLVATKSGYSFGSQNVSTGRSQDDTATCGNVWGVNIVAQQGLTAPVLSTFSINNGASNTVSRTVSLYSACTGGAPTEYQASENSTFSGAAWLPYANPVTFQVSEAEGSKKVYFQVRNSAGASAAKSASIVLAGASSVSLAVALNAPGLTWSTGGSKNWIGQTVVTHDGSSAAASGPIIANQSTWFQTTVAGPGTVSFWWRVSSEAGYDFLTFAVDGVTKTNISGVTAWKQMSFAVPTGSHTLKWAYTKDGSTSLEDDCGYVDQVSYSGQSAAAQFFTFSPVSTLQQPGVPFQASITARDPEGKVVSGFNGTVSFSAVAQSESILFREGFENGFTGWTSEGGFYARSTVGDTCANGLKSFTLSGGNTNTYDGVSHSFAGLRPDRVSFSVRAARSDRVGGYFVFGEEKYRTNSVALFYMGEDGNMNLVMPDLTYWSAPYVAGRWYRIDFLLNWSSKTYDWVVDGVTVAKRVPFCNSDVERINTVNLYNYSNTQAWWDEIEFAKGGLGTRDMLGDPALGGSDVGESYTDGFVFKPNKNLLVTHVRHYYGNKVSIWSDDGTLVSSTPVTSRSGEWSETALATPVTLEAGVGYRVGVTYPAGTEYFWMASRPASFSDGIIVDGCIGYGDEFPSHVTDSSAALFMVDLRYTVGTITPTAVSPTTSGTFVNGVWSGNFSIAQMGANVILTAHDGSGHFGTSIPFNVGAVPTPEISNDNFSDRRVLSGASLVTNCWNTDATKEVGEPKHAGSFGGKSVWFSWKAPASGRLQLNTEGSTLDTVLALYTGSSVSNLTEVASNDDADADLGIRTSALVADVVAGVEYQIAVDGYAEDFGKIILSLDFQGATAGPLLSVNATPGQVVLSWGTNWNGFVLESASTVDSGTLWATLSPSPVVRGQSYIVTNSTANETLFYRLRHP